MSPENAVKELMTHGITASLMDDDSEPTKSLVLGGYKPDSKKLGGFYVYFSSERWEIHLSGPGQLVFHMFCNSLADAITAILNMLNGNTKMEDDTISLDSALEILEKLKLTPTYRIEGLPSISGGLGYNSDEESFENGFTVIRIGKLLALSYTGHQTG